MDTTNTKSKSKRARLVSIFGITYIIIVALLTLGLQYNLLPDSMIAKNYDEQGMAIPITLGVHISFLLFPIIGFINPKEKSVKLKILYATSLTTLLFLHATSPFGITLASIAFASMAGLSIMVLSTLCAWLSCKDKTECVR